ncbi:MULTISPECIES: transporter substrate-binding domain-containing protein [unclassified Pseudodesulfovibrio]|uniref:substrate-binding periplasmic protein n=1 Tax=unclassified Pseudodesulfovibrio TaxID=2661612 RepID=UPI0013E32B3A|nr:MULTISPECIES: transporter substrate-binding domain-containing protein [unclassified Pseudodesulfovibrio]MCJ2162927.1 transporter substrate-binding domain-containing protein [Pseudodesulfovibrio sp. S3-i]
MRISKTTMMLFASLVITGIALARPLVMTERSVKLVCDIWPPYQMNTQYAVTGLSAELVKAVYNRMGITRVEIQSRPWKRALDMVRFGEAEALFSANFTSDREDYLYYPDEPLFESQWVIWTKGNTQIQSLEDLKGKTIGVVLGYSYTPEFWKFIKTYCNVEEVYNDDSNFKKLSLGRLDATVAEYANGLFLAEKLSAPDLRPQVGVTIKKDGLYIVFSRDHTDAKFVTQFSNELRKFKTTIEFKNLWEKYLGMRR